MLDFENSYIQKAHKELSSQIHKKEVIEILDDGRFYYQFLPISVHVDKFDNTIVKLVELSDTEFYEDNQVYRFSLEELIEGRASYLKREDENTEAFNKKFPSLALLDNMSICKN